MEDEDFLVKDVHCINDIMGENDRLGEVNASQIDMRWDPRYDPTTSINRTLAVSSDEDKIELARALIKCWMFASRPYIEWTNGKFGPQIREDIGGLFGKEFGSRNRHVIGSIGENVDRTYFAIWQNAPCIWDDGAAHGGVATPLLEAKGSLEKITSIPRITLPEHQEFTLPNKAKIFVPYHKMWGERFDPF